MIYMTTDEWNNISKLISEHDYYTLAEEIAGNTWRLDLSDKELDAVIRGYDYEKEYYS